MLRQSAAALPYLCLLTAAYSVFCVTTDDPFITYRYAANIWAGHGVVFNPGERVEGFSSPLHLLLMVGLLKVSPGIDILFKAKLLGLAFGVLALWQTGRLAQEAALSRGESLLAQMLVALNTNFAVAAVNGMETTLYTCLVLAAVTAFLREVRQPGRSSSALWLFSSWLARPDALGLFMLLLLVRAALQRRKQRPPHEIVIWTLAFLLPMLCLTVVRLLYYGQLVPNTYFAKRVPLAVGLHDGWAYLLHPLFPTPLNGSAASLAVVLRGDGWWAIFGMLVFWGTALAGGIHLRREWQGVTLLAVILALMLFVLRFGGDWMPGWRFLIPALPLLAVLQVCGLRSLSRASTRRWQCLGIAVVLTLWTICAWTVPHDPWSMAGFSTRSGVLLAADNSLGRKWVAVSRFLQSSVLPGSLVAYSEMGYAGYENMDLRFIDVRGLTDPQIARLPGRYKGPWGVDDESWFRPGDPLYALLRRRRPDWIIAFSSVRQMPTVALGRYYFDGYVGDPHDSRQLIFPALVYRSFDASAGP